MTIRILVTAGALLLAGSAFWDGALGGGHTLNPFGIMFLGLAGFVWFCWEPIRESFRSARNESDLPIIRLNATLIKGLMQRTQQLRPSSSS